METALALSQALLAAHKAAIGEVIRKTHTVPERRLKDAIEQLMLDLGYEINDIECRFKSVENGWQADALKALGKAGYEAAVTDKGRIAVQDPVLCSRGSKEWVEYNTVTLRPDQVAHFINERI